MLPSGYGKPRGMGSRGHHFPTDVPGPQSTRRDEEIDNQNLGRMTIRVWPSPAPAMEEATCAQKSAYL